MNATRVSNVAGGCHCVLPCRLLLVGRSVGFQRVTRGFGLCTALRTIFHSSARPSSHHSVGVTWVSGEACGCFCVLPCRPLYVACLVGFQSKTRGLGLQP